MIRTLLIANRGEIACRVARTARAMGIRTVAVYSEADANARHVEACDEAWPIGPAPARDSYLRIDKILEVARASGADAVHPGYGFLSENAEFARACAEAGVIFVGPPTDAIEVMGSKAGAKKLMEAAGVPLVPGYHGEDQSEETLAAEAERIGYPVLLKASAGGGGKGMRDVHAPDKLVAAIAGAQREASSSFGDDRLLIEKYLQRPRHVEVQVFADGHGNAVHLFERDCSLQRRHQKVIEEAPAPGLDPEIREAMGGAAVAAAKAVNYVGAGTVEFIMDETGFYFMEMNTRLQVEHPVTELITGLDLVELQLGVADGAPLPFEQSDLTITGHAVEARLYAENPARKFLPQIGRLETLRFPENLPGLRIDTGVGEGDSVSQFYDPMIAKVIVHGRDRETAMASLAEALDRTAIAGLTTNRGFLAALARHPKFVAGEVHTGFIPEHMEALLAPSPADGPHLPLACLAVMVRDRDVATARAAASGDPTSPWSLFDGWRMNDEAHHDLTLVDATGAEHLARIVFRPGGYRVECGSRVTEISGDWAADGRLRASLDGRRLDATVTLLGETVRVVADGAEAVFTLIDPMAAAAGADDGGGRLTAPMPGKVIQVRTAVGDQVSRGQTLMVLEAMKMEHPVTAPVDGRVAAVHFAEGDAVEEGAALLELDSGDGA